MPGADFAGALKEADEILAARGVPASADRRLLERLRDAAEQRRDAARPDVESMPANEPRRGSPMGLRLAIPALACVAVLALAIAVGLRGRHDGRAPTAMTQVAGFVLVAGSVDLDLAAHDGLVELRRGHCTLRDADTAMTVALSGHAIVRKRTGGVGVERGRAVFDAEPNGQPRTVTVSHGEIHITGTRFTVEQGQDGGRVELHEGGIELVSPGREPIRVRPGETVAWPVAAAAPPAPASADAPVASAESPPAPPVRTATAAAARPQPITSASAPPADLLARIEALRSQGRYAEAAELASRGSPGAGATRERLSYERGGLLTYQLRDKERACAHWQRHVLEFPDGRYAVEVQRARHHLGCR